MIRHAPHADPADALLASDPRRAGGNVGVVAAARRRGRGAASNRAGRFEASDRIGVDDGWGSLETLEEFRTDVRIDRAQSVISRNDSPDISFDQSINPYRGCEHGCVYCYARPGHAFLGHSPGLDFETILYAKSNAAEVLERELADPGYVAKTIALGAVTDPYQPIERRHRITRAVLEVLARARHPVGIVTKSATVVRDVDLLADMAGDGIVKVAISVTTLDARLARQMEPRAATPSRRLDAIKQLSERGVPTQVMVAPIIPGLNDHEIESILAAAREAGASDGGYVMLRLPLELKDLFREWLGATVPDRASRVLGLLQSMHGGRDYRSEFGVRGRGSGPYASLVASRFRLALKRLGMNERSLRLRTDLFRRPVLPGQQMSLL